MEVSDLGDYYRCEDADRRIAAADSVASALDKATGDGSLLYADRLPQPLSDLLNKWRTEVARDAPPPPPRRPGF